MTSIETRIGDAEQVHSSAVDELSAHADRIADEIWNVPVAEGKWTPSQIVSHLTLAYEALIAELSTGSALRVRTKWWQRALLYFTVRRNILAGRAFPRGIRAPREIAPSPDSRTRHESLAAFRSRADEFVTLLRATMATRKVRLTHPFLGRMNAAEALRFCAAHVSHHGKQLPAVDSVEADRT